MATIGDILVESSAALAAAGIEDSRREASSLLALALGRDRTFLIANPDLVLDETDESRFRALMGKRADRVPFQHLAGVQEFYGLDFRVTPAVLIPRPETEFAVEAALKLLGQTENPRFAEVGVGSGCIAVSLLHGLPGGSAVGLELSEEAIEVASENALRHGVLSRLELRRSDVFSALRDDERFDLIISNPPYIPASEMDGLQPEVRDHDPKQALTDGGDGLSVIRRIVAETPMHLAPRGSLIIEIGHGQRDLVESLFDPGIWGSPHFVDDLQGIPRVAVARRG